MTGTSTRWQIDRFGRAQLRLAHFDTPRPQAGQVLVAVDAVSLNHRDLLLCQDEYGWTPALPFTPGSDLAGTVAAVGPGVSRWRPGDRVISAFFAGWLEGDAPPPEAQQLGGPGPGVLASHVVLDAQWLSAAPRTLTPVQASTLPCAALTAWFALVETAGLRAGQTVVIHGTGGVALFGLQFARMHGAAAVVVTGSREKGARVQALGASHVLARDAQWPQALRRITDGRGADHVLELAGGPSLSRSVSALAQGGHVSVVGLLEPGDIPADLTFEIIRSRARLQGVRIGHRRSLEDMVRAIEVNRLEPVIDAVYDAADVPKAFEHLAAGPFGKVVVTFAAATC